MRAAVGTANLLLGLVYTAYGFITIMDMKRGWRRDGFSHFGAAWIAMAFTCGPHHVEHGLHVLLAGRAGTGLDLAVVLVGAPAGITWFLLRVEAFRGGAGDRMVRGTPNWVAALPFLGGLYLAGVGSAFALILSSGTRVPSALAPNTLLVALYTVIGIILLRTQLASRRRSPGWSLSGLSLGLVFPTCAVMHAVFVVYAAAGRYDFDGHLAAIDWLGVPAAAYFLWVVRRLYADELQDWNTASHGEPVLVG